MTDVIKRSDPQPDDASGPADRRRTRRPMWGRVHVSRRIFVTCSQLTISHSIESFPPTGTNGCIGGI
jgi:hypothetical protein